MGDERSTVDGRTMEERNAATSAAQVRAFRSREVSADVCYLASDGRTVTTWTGDVLGTVTRIKTACVGFRDVSGRRPIRYFVTFSGIDGRTWRAIGPGPSMYLRARVVAS